MAEQSVIQYAGKNTIEALIRNAQGDMSNLTGAIVPTFEEVYQNIESLQRSKEEVFKIVTKAEYDALSDEEKQAGNFVVTDENTTATDIEARAHIGSLSDLSTTTKTNLVAAINEVKQSISNIEQFAIVAVATLPEENIRTDAIYLVPSENSSTGDLYDEYVYVNNSWEKIGSATIDLSGYATQTWVQGLGYQTASDVSVAISGKADSTDLDGYVEKVVGKGLSTEDYTAEEKAKLAGLEQVTVDDELLSTSENPVMNKVIYNSLNEKVDKITGKMLSTEDYTTEEKTKLAGLSNYDDTALANRVTALEFEIPDDYEEQIDAILADEETVEETTP